MSISTATLDTSVDQITVQKVLQILNESKPERILDAPSGSGWLPKGLCYRATVDGVDLFTQQCDGYRRFVIGDLNEGIPGGG